MVLHRTLADADICGDILAGTTVKDHLHDLALPFVSRCNKTSFCSMPLHSKAYDRDFPPDA